MAMGGAVLRLAELVFGRAATHDFLGWFLPWAGVVLFSLIVAEPLFILSCAAFRKMRGLPTGDYPSVEAVGMAFFIGGFVTRSRKTGDLPTAGGPRETQAALATAYSFDPEGPPEALGVAFFFGGLLALCVASLLHSSFMALAGVVLLTPFAFFPLFLLGCASARKMRGQPMKDGKQVTAGKLVGGSLVILPFILLCGGVSS